jgi:mono/diheme cytochrome c family protein
MSKVWGLMLAISGLGFGTSAFAVDAQKLFSEKCAVCHGAKGEGTATGPAQRGDEFIVTAKPTDVKRVIMEGRAGADKLYPNIPVDMPRGLVSEAEADALVTFLRSDLQK